MAAARDEKFREEKARKDAEANLSIEDKEKAAKIIADKAGVEKRNAATYAAQSLQWDKERSQAYQDEKHAAEIASAASAASCSRNFMNWLLLLPCLYTQSRPVKIRWQY